MNSESSVQDEDWLGFDWSPWLELHPDSDEISSLPTDPGLYRVRHNVYDGLIYIGETGRSVRGRVRSLIRGTFDEEMPFSDPHTASPSLWAIADRHGAGFEISATVPPEVEDKQQRKAIEDALIALHRRETETNLIGNFGRMPPGYEKSKKRSSGIRGGPDDDSERSFRDGVDPLSWNYSDEVTGREWMGLCWSEPILLGDSGSQIPDEAGTYRLWDAADRPPLEYLGETVNLKNRLASHRRNRDDDLLLSYTVIDVSRKFQLSQIETELLGAHWLACGQSPRDQY